MWITARVCTSTRTRRIKECTSFHTLSHSSAIASSPASISPASEQASSSQLLYQAQNGTSLPMARRQMSSVFGSTQVRPNAALSTTNSKYSPVSLTRRRIFGTSKKRLPFQPTSTMSAPATIASSRTQTRRRRRRCGFSRRTVSLITWIQQRCSESSGKESTTTVSSSARTFRSPSMT